VTVSRLGDVTRVFVNHGDHMSTAKDLAG
jgi:hypothetical protein